MLAVNARRGPCQHRRHLHSERREIAGMYDARPQLPQKLPDLHIEAWCLARRLVERVTLDARPSYAEPEVRIVRDAHDGVAVSLRRHVVEEINEPVLPSSGLQAVDHVGDQGGAACSGSRFGTNELSAVLQVPIAYWAIRVTSEWLYCGNGI